MLVPAPPPGVLKAPLTNVPRDQATVDSGTICYRDGAVHNDRPIVDEVRALEREVAVQYDRPVPLRGPAVDIVTAGQEHANRSIDSGRAGHLRI